jgi:hypothetical protein
MAALCFEHAFLVVHTMEARSWTSFERTKAVLCMDRYRRTRGLGGGLKKWKDQLSKASIEFAEMQGQ